MNLLDFTIPDWFWVAFSLLVLILVLRKILWNPVNKVLEARQERAVKAGQDAEEAARLRAEMERLRVQLDAELEARTSKLMQEARGRAGREYDRIIDDAEKKAGLILAAARKEAEQERERMMVGLQKQVAATALEATGLLLGANMDGEQNNRLLDAFLAQKDVSL